MLIIPPASLSKLCQKVSGAVNMPRQGSSLVPRGIFAIALLRLGLQEKSRHPRVLLRRYPAGKAVRPSDGLRLRDFLAAGELHVRGVGRAAYPVEFFPRSL